MSAIRSFRELQTCRRARTAAREVLHLTKRFAGEKRHSQADRIRRSLRAIGAILAEARGGANESRSWLDRALEREYIDTAEHGGFDAQLRELGAMPRRMIDQSDTFRGPANR